MGIVATTPVARPGFNDGLVLPYERSTGGPALEPVSPEPKKPQKRKMHAIALLVDFSDNKGERSAKDFEKLLFDKANQNSMTSFYRQLSYGALDVTGEVIGYVRAPQPYSYYTATESGTGTNYPRNTPGLLNDALTVFCQNDNITRFDQTEDDYQKKIATTRYAGGKKDRVLSTLDTRSNWARIFPSRESSGQRPRCFASGFRPCCLAYRRAAVKQ